MYTDSILMMISWPALIIISYQLVKFVVKKYEGRQGNIIKDKRQKL